MKKTDELKTSEGLSKEELSREREKQYQSGIYALSKEYASVYYVKLDTGEVYPYNLSARIEGMFGDQFYKLDYEKAIVVYVEKAVIESEKKKMLHILSPEYIIRKLKTSDSFTKVYLNNNNEYCEMKCVKIEQEDGSNVAVMGFAVKDKEIRQEQQLKEEFTMQYALLEGLSHEYNSVWLAKPNRQLELFRAYKPETRDMLRSIRRDGRNIEPVIKHYIHDYIVPDDREDLLELFDYDALMQRIPEQGVVKHTYRRIVKGDEYRYMQVIIAKARDPHGWANLIIAFRDVDDIVRYRMQQEAALNKAIRARDHDTLTKLKNRYYYERQLEVYADMDYESITCIYIDVNGLHEVNNEKGHEAGDDMLRRVALYISKIWGDENSYRIGGDEFVVFVFDKEKEDITGDVEGFGKALSTYGYSASVGYARGTGKVDDIQDLIRDAETEMYKAKKDHYKGARDRRRRQ
ncbi:MAG: GGDEF domain-containing protein [Lachnospiraceae bacterium]|nr:GGDEF domain-containing protein [Lachnospiraceae bacterium]